MDIDLWFEALTITDEEYRYYWSLLDKNEQDKALRFVQTRHGRGYVASHGKLRLILAEYLCTPPEEIPFETHVHGKPFIAGHGNRGIKFNLAHSGNYLAVGVAQDCDIGVDIEAWTDTVDYAAVLNMCFSDAECRFWINLPAEQKQAFFYMLWTRKESFVKAVGLGLALDVAQVKTSLVKPSRFLSLPSECGSPGNWSLIDLKLTNCLSGAVTVPVGCPPKIIYKQLS